MMHHFIFLCSLFLSFSLSSSHIFKYLYNFTSRVYSSVCLRGLGGPIRSVQFLNTKQNWMVQGGGEGRRGLQKRGRTRRGVEQTREIAFISIHLSHSLSLSFVTSASSLAHSFNITS